MAVGLCIMLKYSVPREMEAGKILDARPQGKVSSLERGEWMKFERITIGSPEK